MIDPDEFLARLVLAGRALKHLPQEARPAKNKAWWPLVIKQAQESYGYQEVTVTRRRPTIDEMTALEWLLDAVWCLSEHQRAILLARVQGMSWRKISRAAQRMGHKPSSHESCRQIYRQAENIMWQNQAI